MAISMKAYMGPQDLHIVFSVNAKTLKCFDFGGKFLWNCDVMYDPKSTLPRPIKCMNRGNIAVVCGGYLGPIQYVELDPPNDSGAKFERTMGVTYGQGTISGDVQFHGSLSPGGHSKGFESSPDVPYAGYVLVDYDMTRLLDTIKFCNHGGGAVFCTVTD